MLIPLFDKDGIEEYYRDYAQLRTHFLRRHYLCELDECSANAAHTHEYVVFRTELDFQAHKRSKHAKSKIEQKQMSKINIEFATSTTSGSGGRQSQHSGRQQRASNRREEATNDDYYYREDDENDKDFQQAIRRSAAAAAANASNQRQQQSKAEKLKEQYEKYEQQNQVTASRNALRVALAGTWLTVYRQLEISSFRAA